MTNNRLNKIMYLGALIPIFVLITPSLSYASSFTAFNVNLNETIDLPTQPTYPKTTIQDHPCIGPGIAGNGRTEDINRENQTNHAMWLSDSKVFIESIIAEHIYWCGIEK